MKKKVLVLDRVYNVKYMKSDIFDVIVVCLSETSKKAHIKEGLNVVACFDEEYDSLPIADYPGDYLVHSFDSDRCLKKFSFEKRREILGKEISFWRNIFDTYHPDCIVNEVVTIELMEVMFIEAKKRGIPYYRWGLWPMTRLDIWVKDSPYDSRMSREYWESISENEEDREKAKKYIEQIRSVGTKPFFLLKSNDSKVKLKIIAIYNYLMVFVRHFIKLIKHDKGFYGETYDEAKQALNYKWSRLLHHNYDELNFSQDTEYFFFPLHYEPEATIEYFGFHFNNQVMLIERIAHCLKVNQKLIVKEHPQQAGALMLKRYRELKNTFSNLVYLPGNISSSKIFPNIKCLVTLTGTAGFESWISKRPVIVFGEVFYKDFPGMIQCDSFKQLYDIIRNDKYQVADEETIINYVAKMYHQVIEMFPNIKPGVSKAEDTQNITKQVEHLISGKN